MLKFKTKPKKEGNTSQDMFCRVCGNSFFKLRHDLGEYKYMTCLNCSAVMIYPFPEDDEARKWYLIDDYYANSDRNIGYEDYVRLKKGLVKTYERRNRLINAGSLFEKKKILEIGCGPGYYPETLKSELIPNYTGLDLNKGAIKALKEKGFNGIEGEIGELPEDNLYDIVIMFDVLEHILEPNKFLKLLRKRMKPGGKIILTTPSTTSMLSRISGKKWVSYIVPQHVVLYNPEVLKNLFVKNNFHAEIMKTDLQWADIAFIAKRIANNLLYLKGTGWLLKLFSKISGFEIPVINGNIFCVFGLNNEI